MANGILIAAGAALAAWAASKPRTDAGKTLRAAPERGDGFVTGFSKDTALWGTTVGAVRPLKAPPVPTLPRPLVQIGKDDPRYQAFPYAILLFRPDVVWSGEQGTNCKPLGGNLFYERVTDFLGGAPSVSVLVDPLVGGVTDAMTDAALKFVRSGAYKSVVETAGMAYPSAGLKQIAATVASVGVGAGSGAAGAASALGATIGAQTATGVGVVAAGFAGAALGIASLFGTRYDLPEAFEVGGYWETIVRERRSIGAQSGIGTLYSSEGLSSVYHLRDSSGRGVFEAFELVAREANT